MKTASVSTELRSCRNCKWGDAPFLMTKKIYLNCQVPVSDELRMILPASFYRRPLMHIGNLKRGVQQFNNNNADCPAWEQKAGT